MDNTLEATRAELRVARWLKITDSAQELKACQVFIVTISTPIDRYRRPDLALLIRASTTVGRALKPGGVGVYESTVYAGCTEEVCVPILEHEYGLKLNPGFFVGYSPERVNPEDKQHRLLNDFKVTSGSTAEAAQFIDAMYRSDVFDPWVRRADAMHEYRIRLASRLQRGVYDGMVLAVPNRVFREMGARQLRSHGGRKHLLYDIKYAFPARQVDVRI